jgi:hypothetical protein
LINTSPSGVCFSLSRVSLISQFEAAKMQQPLNEREREGGEMIGEFLIIKRRRSTEQTCSSPFADLKIDELYCRTTEL